MAKSKSKFKRQLAVAGVISITAIYLYFAYSREMFPFTKGLKTKINTLIKGESEASEIPPAVGEGDNFEEEIFAPSGVPGTLSNLDLTDLYNLMVYNQRRLEGQYDEEGLLQGGDYPGTYRPEYDRDPGYEGEEGDLEDLEEEWDHGPRDDRPIFDPSKYRDRDEEHGGVKDEGEGEDMERRRHRHGRRSKWWWKDIRLPPDIPEEIPDEALADIGQLRDVRDRLLAQIELLKQDLQDQIDSLEIQIEEEREAREELEEVVEEMKEEITQAPPEEKTEKNARAVEVIAIARARHDEVMARVEILHDAIEARKESEVKAVEVVNWVNSVVVAATATAGTGTSTRSTTSVDVPSITSRIDSHISARTGIGTSAGTGTSTSTSTRTGSTSYTTSRTSLSNLLSSASSGGGAVACAGSICVKANRAGRVGVLSRSERQYAFSKLQNRARRMNTVKIKPTAFLKNRQFLNVLPPVVKKRHLGTRIHLS